MESRTVFILSKPCLRRKKVHEFEGVARKSVEKGAKHGRRTNTDS